MRRARVPGLLLLAAAAFHLSVFASVALGRLTYPFEVEFLEGLTIDYAKTLAAGGNLYAPPSLHFAPNWYPPLHYLVSLPMLWLSGWELWGARLVSIGSVLGASGIGAVLLRRLGVSWAAVWASAAVAFAYYPGTHYWYDVARVDSLQVFFAMAGLALLASRGARPTPRALLWGAVLLIAAVFTKQTAVVLCVAALGYFVLDRDVPRRNALFGAFAALSTVGAAILLAAYGRDAFIIYWAPQHHFRNIPVGTLRFFRFAWTMLPLALIATWALRGSADAPRGRVLRLYLLALAPALAMGWITMCKRGGDGNSSMPAIFILSVCVGLALDSLLTAPATSWRPVWVSALLATFLLVAFRDDHLAWIPTRADRREAAEILADMRAVPGPFFAYNSFVSTTLRGDMYPYFDRLYDWAGGQNQATHFRPDPARYPPEFMNAIRTHHFAVIYTNGSDYFGDPAYRLIEASYQPVRLWPPTQPDGAPLPRWKNVVPRLRWEPR